MNNIPTVTKNLLLINVIAFAVTWLFELRGVDLASALGLHFFLAGDFGIYQFLTYMFLHGSFMHLFFNMFALWMFGTTMERVWGSRRFLVYYLLCGIGAGLTQELVQYIQYASEGLAAYQNVSTSSGVIPMDVYLNLWTTIGASGSIYGVLMAFGMTFPNERMFIIPIPFPIKAKWLITGYIAIELYSAFNSPGDGVAHMAHLGGMLFGFLLIRYWRSHPGSVNGFGTGSDVFDVLKQRFRKPKENKFHYQRPVEPRQETKKERENQAEIDAILDKIRMSGYDSLTKEEKKKLFDQSQKN